MINNSNVIDSKIAETMPNHENVTVPSALPAEEVNSELAESKTVSKISNPNHTTASSYKVCDWLSYFSSAFCRKKRRGVKTEAKGTTIAKISNIKGKQTSYKRKTLPNLAPTKY